MKKITGELQSGYAKRECLLRQDNFVSKSVSVKREGRELDWEASTLPLSYTRLICYFKRKSHHCKDILRSAAFLTGSNLL